MPPLMQLRRTPGDARNSQYRRGTSERLGRSVAGIPPRGSRLPGCAGWHLHQIKTRTSGALRVLKGDLGRFFCGRGWTWQPSAYGGYLVGHGLKSKERKRKQKPIADHRSFFAPHVNLCRAVGRRHLESYEPWSNSLPLP